MDLELWYKGSIRRISGSGMAYANFSGKVGEDKINKKETTAIPDSHIIVREIREDGIDFSFFFFDKEERIFLTVNESTSLKNEGNAFGYEIIFEAR